MQAHVRASFLCRPAQSMHMGICLLIRLAWKNLNDRFVWI